MVTVMQLSTTKSNKREWKMLRANGDIIDDINDDTKRVIFNTILLTSALSTLDELVGEDDLKNELGEIILDWFQKNMKAEVEDGT